MNIPVNLLTWSMAILPVIVLIILLIAINMKASKASIIGVLITILTGYFIYKGDLKLIGLEVLKGAWSSITILLIILTAILLYQVGIAANAFHVIKNKISEIIPNELLAIYALGWVFVSFLQGITGFGVPVAVGAPLLIGLGVKPIFAIVISLLGQSWGNTFGTLAAAWDSLVISTGLEVASKAYLTTAFWAAFMLFVWIFIMGLAISWYYGKMEGIKKGMPAVIILSLIMGGGELLFTQFNTTLSAFIPSALALVGVIGLAKTRFYNTQWRVSDSPMMDCSKRLSDEEVESDMNLFHAFMPYIVLSVLTLLVLMIKPLNDLLSKVKLGFAFPETKTGYGFINPAYDLYSPLAPFTHAGFFLLISSLVGLFYYMAHGWIKREQIKDIFNRSFKMALPSATSVVALIIMSRIMGGTGQTSVMAMGIASVLGVKYLALSPFVGLLGTFITGSNMSSNILFGQFQLTTAELLKSNTTHLLAAQTAGASIGSCISPSKIILGTSTANLIGQEGSVMKKILTIALPVTLMFGLAVLLSHLIL